MAIHIDPVAFVRNSRKEPKDDRWEEIISEIELADSIPEEALKGISDFSHLEIIYYFHKAEAGDIVFSGRPRENPEYPVVGIFCQRKKDRPNRIGLCTVELLGHTGRIIRVKYLDAIDGTPVLDIKPVMKGFKIASLLRQPAWATDIMKNYWC